MIPFAAHYSADENEKGTSVSPQSANAYRVAPPPQNEARASSRFLIAWKIAEGENGEFHVFIPSIALMLRGRLVRFRGHFQTR